MQLTVCTHTAWSGLQMCRACIIYLSYISRKQTRATGVLHARSSRQQAQSARIKQLIRVEVHTVHTCVLKSEQSYNLFAYSGVVCRLSGDCSLQAMWRSTPFWCCRSHSRLTAHQREATRRRHCRYASTCIHTRRVWCRHHEHSASPAGVDSAGEHSN